jgi:leucyl-tRNA synthetase
MKSFLPTEIEAAAQSAWRAADAYRADERADKPKYYCVSMLPYPPASCTWGTCATTRSTT